MDDPSARKYRLGDALCRLCSEKDETSWMPAQCLGFDGNSCDGNLLGAEDTPSQKNWAADPLRRRQGHVFVRDVREGLLLVPARRRRSTCKECAGARAFREHGRRRSTARSAWGSSIREHLPGGCEAVCCECGGSSICEHGRQRPQCKECGGSQICEHGRVRNQCKECGGSQICEHGRRRSSARSAGAHRSASTEAAKHVQGVRGLGHLRAREAAIFLQGVRGQGHLRAREAAKQLQGLPRRLTCCVFGNVFNTTGRYVSHPSLACPWASASRRFATRWSAKPQILHPNPNAPAVTLNPSAMTRVRALGRARGEGAAANSAADQLHESHSQLQLYRSDSRVGLCPRGGAFFFLLRDTMKPDEPSIEDLIYSV